MKVKTVLITGGAGFIGTHLVQALHGSVEQIVVLDNLLPQIHLGRETFSQELQSKAICIQGDVRDIETLKRIVTDYPEIEVVVHLAAMTGTGQSMYAVREYDSVNSGGTATLLEAVLDKRDPKTSFAALKKVVLSSSRAIYGEGAYQCTNCKSGIEYPPLRSAERLRQELWGFPCPQCGMDMEPILTPEEAPAQPTSFYGVTKLVQEQYLQTMLCAAGIKQTTLRFQNVFGPGQSLKNPYTGVIGVFYSNIVGGRTLNIFEDGQITRDFVYVTDVVASLVSAITTEAEGTFNIGTGLFTPLMDVARWLCEALETQVPIQVTGAYRVGDIRHNAADLRRATEALGYSPQVTVQEGLHRYVAWAKQEQPMDAETIARAAAELKAAGLAGGKISGGA